MCQSSYNMKFGKGGLSVFLLLTMILVVVAANNFMDEILARSAGVPAEDPEKVCSCAKCPEKCGKGCCGYCAPECSQCTKCGWCLWCSINEGCKNCAGCAEKPKCDTWCKGCY